MRAPTSRAWVVGEPGALALIPCKALRACCQVACNVDRKSDMTEESWPLVCPIYSLNLQKYHKFLSCFLSPQFPTKTAEDPEFILFLTRASVKPKNLEGRVSTLLCFSNNVTCARAIQHFVVTEVFMYKVPRGRPLERRCCCSERGNTRLIPLTSSFLVSV